MRLRQDFIDVCLMSVGACAIGIGVDRFLYDTPCHQHPIGPVEQGEKIFVPYSGSEMKVYKIKSIAVAALGVGCFTIGANSFFGGKR